MKRLGGLRALLLLLLLASACAEDAPTEPEGEGEAAVVSMPGFTFSPFTTTVRAGGRVIFDFPAEPHNVIFERRTGAPADVQVTAGREVSRTFAVAGTFPYDCTLHPGMRGVVVVTP